MEDFAERRRRVLEGMNGGVALVGAAPVHIRNNDVEHEYRQDSDLYYLSGFEEPESLLLLSNVHEEHQTVMFVRPRDREREVWDGVRAGVDGAIEQLGVDAAFPIAELRRRLPDYLRGASELHYELGKDKRLDDWVLRAVSQTRARGRSAKPWPRDIKHPEPLWHEMRLHKSDTELELMRRAQAITAEAHRGAMRLAEPGVYEYQVEAQFRETFLRHGAQRSAYAPIVGSGPNATVLHYVTNRRKLEDGDLLLIDAGCEFGFYAADVTRTFPVNGRFSEPQRRVYQVVLDAQLAALEGAKPGGNIDDLHAVTVRALVKGMVDIGLLSGSVDPLIEKEVYKRYYMHRTSHWLGMDVHDVGAYYLDGSSRPFEPGMVFTIEPGIYVAADDKDAPEEYRGIGVRIEDDILITDEGHENLSAAVPKTIDDVERACRG
jgi:Xaa-Pro aminopeptidase